MRLALVLCVGCGRLGFDVEVRSDAPIDAPVPLGPWSAPILVIDRPSPADDPSLTRDQLELYVNNDTEVHVRRRATVADAWGPLEAILDVGTSITQPFVSADGLTLYMTDFDQVAVSTRPTRSDPWSAPVVVPELNTPLPGGDAAPRPDELELVLTVVDGGTSQLGLLRRAARTDPWGTPEPIDAIDIRATEGCLGERGLALYFNSDPVNGFDIYRSERAALDQPFGPPVAVDELNTDFEDSDPWVSEDGRTIYFTSTRGGRRQIWMATR